MTKAEEFEKAWRLGYKNNFSMVDQIYHPKYSALERNTGVEVNLEADKIIISTYGEYLTIGPFRLIFEDENFLCLERIYRSNLTGGFTYNVGITAVTYLDERIITQESTNENDVPDPSEGQDWNWEDYE